MTKWQDAKKSVVNRDGGKCLKCRKVATDVHHRRPRGMGGTSDDHISYGMANLVSLCRTCHDWVHANPWPSYTLGWLVKTGEDPDDVPIYTDADVIIKLLPDGTTKMQACGLRF
jgi:5-methylcytosine-specific restriction protein A